jgi:curli biogenesis system outer membrane secretion channel CsgG
MMIAIMTPAPATTGEDAEFTGETYGKPVLKGIEMVRSTLAATAALLLLLGPATALAGSHNDDDAAVVEHSKTSDALEALPRLPVSQRKVVTIYQFKSGVPSVANNALTDMFVNALMESGAFLVAERENLNTDIATEKTLNGQGKTTGDTAQQKLAAAQFIFSGTVSESNESQDSTQNTFSLGGAQVGGQDQKGKLAIDVRVYDADSGLVLDSIVVSKIIRSKTSGVSGVGSLANSIAGLGGHSIPLSPDMSTQTTHNDGVDEALRACIETAVLELVKRYGSGGQ